MKPAMLKPIYEDKAHTPTWQVVLNAVFVAFWLLFGLFSALLTLIAGSVWIALFALALSLMGPLFAWVLFPQKYEIYEDRLCMVLRGSVRFSFSFSTIKQVYTDLDPASWFRGTFNRDHAVGIGRPAALFRSLHPVIFPENREEFVRQLTNAIKQYRESPGRPG